MATFEILPAPLGSQFSPAIGSDNINKNDFDVFIVADQNVDGLSLSKLSISSVGGILVSAASFVGDLEGEHSVYKIRVRPPAQTGFTGNEYDGTITITIAANAVTQGNPETSQDIKFGNRLPIAGAPQPVTEFAHNTGNSGTAYGIAVTKNRIYILTGRTLYSFLHDGTEQISERRTSFPGGSRTARGRLDYINDTLLFYTDAGLRRYNLITEESKAPFAFSVPGTFEGGGATHTDEGYLTSSGTTIYFTSYSAEDANDIVASTPQRLATTVLATDIAYSQGLIYQAVSGSRGNLRIFEMNENNEAIYFKDIDVNIGGSVRGVGVFRDKLYILRQTEVQSFDIRTYRRPIAKTTIYPIFVNEGDTLDVLPLCPNAEKIIFDVGYKKPPFLSINANNQLVVASNAVTGPIFVKLKGINHIGSTPDDSFSFYLVIRQAQAPVWRPVTELSMRANSSYDLHQIVDADEIVFRSGRTQPTDSSINEGVFRIGTEGGTAEFTARKAGHSSHIAIDINVIQHASPANFSDVFRHRVEISGIDVSTDVKQFPNVSKSLDAVELNKYAVDETTLILKDTGGKYNPDMTSNFWSANSLNAGGFGEPIKVFVESLVNGSWVSSLLFSGIIHKQAESISEIEVRLRCYSISWILRNSDVRDFGTLQKWGVFRQHSDESSFESVYVPDNSLLPMQVGTGEAWSDSKKLTMSRLQLPSEGIPPEDTGYMTETDFRVAGGFLETNPILRFKTVHRSEDVRFLINQLGLNSAVYNTEIDLPELSLDRPFILNRGSVALSVEDSRITRLPVDWIDDATDNRILILLSNPESHISDLLVQHHLQTDSYRVLHTFEKDVAVHQIARRSNTNYYIIASKAIAADRSENPLPRQTDAVGSAYDAAAENSETRIYHYNTASSTLTEHVAATDSHPPQVGTHYHVGFENMLYADSFEGIRPEYRGPFKWVGSYLYYRYATLSEFGVARVNAAGTTTQMIEQTTLNYNNHLNFAFDVTTTGTIYFVYAIGDATSSTLVIKRRTSGGTVSTILEETKHLPQLTDVDGLGGAFLGAHECLFHNNHLYILAPIQLLDLGDNAENPQADPDFIIEIEDTGMTGERYVTTSTNLNPSSTRLAPGQDIPVRIDFNGSVSGATQNNLKVFGGTITAFNISSDMIDVTIRPSSRIYHTNILIELAENAVDQRNEKTRILIDFGARRGIRKSAGMALYRCDVTAANPSLTLIEKWDFGHQGACNLTAHDGAVHFVEQPTVAGAFKPINPNLDGYYTDEKEKTTMGYNVIPESLGALKKVNSSGEIEPLGNLWYEERPYNIAVTRCLSFDDELHVVMGYGNLNELLRHNSLASRADNVQHLVYGKKLQYVIPTFSPSGDVYTELAKLAKEVNATLAFDGRLISIKDRRTLRAKTDGSTGIGTSNLDYDSENKRFPSSGYLLIEKEILGYTGISSGAFTGITRGLLGTKIVNHADNTEICFLNTLIQTSDITDINIDMDTARVYNIIRDSDNRFDVRDDASIALHGKRPYVLDLGLTHHEKAWTEAVYESYLSELKDLKKEIQLQIAPRNDLEVGQFVGFVYDELVYGMRILAITYGAKRTRLTGRTL